MDPRLAKLYRTCPTLRPDYIRNVLGLEDARADLVAKINGGIHPDEAELVARVAADVDPQVSLEVGLGYGFSALAICTAREPTAKRRHIVIDPHQTTHWNGDGMRHLAQAGLADIVELREEASYRVLPELEREGLKLDLAFIDGWHTFDFVFVDFFYIDKLLRQDGVVIFDDADWPSIRPVIRYAVTNLDYVPMATLPEKKQREPIDLGLGLEGSCIALRKARSRRKREIFFHRDFC